MTAPAGSVLSPWSTEILALAREAIRHGLEFRRPPAIDPSRHPPALAAPGACFVSLHIGADLRGCIGQTEPVRPLAENLVHNAYAAAFRDPRFAPLAPAELAALSIEVHVLTALEPLAFTDLPGLYAALRPGRDGLQLEAGSRRGVFLPVMWQQLPTPQRFVAHLLRKAGIGGAGGLCASRFGAQVFAEATPGPERLKGRVPN